MANSYVISRFGEEQSATAVPWGLRRYDGLSILGPVGTLPGDPPSIRARASRAALYGSAALTLEWRGTLLASPWGVADGSVSVEAADKGSCHWHAVGLSQSRGQLAEGAGGGGQELSRSLLVARYKVWRYRGKLVHERGGRVRITSEPVLSS